MASGVFWGKFALFLVSLWMIPEDLSTNSSFVTLFMLGVCLRVLLACMACYLKDLFMARREALSCLIDCHSVYGESTRRPKEDF